MPGPISACYQHGDPPLLTLGGKDIGKRLADCRKKFEGMGAARSDEKAQRAYLGKLANNFERIVGYSLNAYYTEDPMFDDRLEMRLVTRIIELNEVFCEVFSKRGHTRRFDFAGNSEEADTWDGLTELGFELPEAHPDLADIVLADRFECPSPSTDSIMEHIEQEFRQSRGPELGTVSLRSLVTPWAKDSSLADHPRGSLVVPCSVPSSRSNPNTGKTLSSRT